VLAFCRRMIVIYNGQQLPGQVESSGLLQADRYVFGKDCPQEQSFDLVPYPSPAHMTPWGSDHIPHWHQRRFVDAIPVLCRKQNNPAQPQRPTALQASSKIIASSALFIGPPHFTRPRSSIAYAPPVCHRHPPSPTCCPQTPSFFASRT
jgi:hypothetical protein